MQLKDVLKRKHYLSMPLSKLESPKFVIEATKTSDSTSEIESVLKSWKDLNHDEDFALVEASKILGGYLEHCSDSNAHKLAHIVNEEFIPSVKNIDKCKELFDKNIKNDHIRHHFEESFNLNANCDRVLKNQIALNKLGFNDIIKEFSIADDTDKEICIENLCDFIDNLKIKNSVKYNLALENILYSTSGSNKYNKKDILESVTSYFFSKNDLSEDDIDHMQSVLIESPLYDDTDKSNVLYVFELSKSDLNNDDYGLPDQKKYPMPDQKHVLSAIKFFNYVSPDDEKVLANNIKKKIKKFKIKNIHVGDKNNFKKYYNEAASEETKKCPFCEATGAKSKIIAHIKKNHKDKLKKSNESIESLLEKASKVKCPFCSGLYEATAIKSHIDKDHKDKAHSKLAEAVIKKALNENHSNYSSNTDSGIGNENNDNDSDSLKDTTNTKKADDSKEEDTQSTISADDSKGVNSYKKNLTTESAKKIINKIKNPKKEIKNEIKSFSISKDKSVKGLKALLEKIFTKSPENIIEEVPDILGVIRRVLILSTVAIAGPIGPIISIIGIFTNKIIELKLRKPQMERVVKKYKKESEKLDRMILKANSEKKKTALKEMKKKIDSDLDKLERYQDNLYSEKELDKRYEQEYSEATDLIGNNIEERISINDFLKIYHKQMVAEIYRAINALQVILENNPNFSKLIDNPALSISSPHYFHTFELPDANIMEKFINYGKVTVKLAKFFPLKYAKSYMLNGNYSAEIKTILNELCEYLQDLLDIGYTVYFDGCSDDLYYIMIELKYHIIGTPKESTCLIEQCEAIDCIDEQMTLLLNGKLDKLLENCKYAINKDTVEDISTVLEECADFLITKEEAISVLESFFSSIKDKIDFNTTKLKSFIKKAIDKIKKKPVQENTYMNNILEYDKLYNLNEAIDSILELSVTNHAKMAAIKLKNKAALMKDKEHNLSKKLDDSLERIDDNLRKQTSNNAREKIVKGRVLPKASKLVKYGIATGVAYAVNPALAAIGVIGGIGVSKLGSKKEKQYILDEIDIQLKLVERKIQLAENNNDMKSLEELFKIEKKLKRERQRIFYNMKAMYPVSAN